MSPESAERLQKILAHAGVASRRKSEELILQGRVSVNGRVVTKLGTKVNPIRDEIRVDGQLVKARTSHVYIMLNKPKGVLSTMEDDRGRQALGDLIATTERLYPVGRLAVSSQGLVLLTNDGELANLLTHPRYRHDKEYRVLVNGSVSLETEAAWERGVMLEGQLTAPAVVDVLRKEKHSTLLRIVMHEGRKRQIRRVAELLGHPVRELTRVRLGPLSLGTLPEGQWRHLASKEVAALESVKRSTRRKGSRRPGRGKKKT